MLPLSKFRMLTDIKLRELVISLVSSCSSATGLCAALNLRLELSDVLLIWQEVARMMASFTEGDELKVPKNGLDKVLSLALQSLSNAEILEKMVGKATNDPVLKNKVKLIKDTVETCTLLIDGWALKEKYSSQFGEGNVKERAN